MDPNQAAIHPELTEPEVLKDAEAKVFYATQWQLMWWKLANTKLLMRPW